MLTKRLIELRDFFHAKLSYQLFITPLPIRMPKEYIDFTERALHFIQYKRSNKIEFSTPRHHVVHHFQQDNPAAKKILITHGWTSRAAYMMRTIRMLHQQGYEVYALDFPAHGESRGLQLTWIEAVAI